MRYLQIQDNPSVQNQIRNQWLSPHQIQNQNQKRIQRSERGSAKENLIGIPSEIDESADDDEFELSRTEPDATVVPKVPADEQGLDL